MKKNELILVITIILFCSCVRETKVNNNDFYKRDSLFLDQYLRISRKEKGKDYYFIPKDKVDAILKNENRKNVSIVEAQVNDLVSFYDTIGNIVYQAEISKIENSKIFIECLNLVTFMKYQTELNLDSVKDLNKNNKYEIKVYR